MEIVKSFVLKKKDVGYVNIHLEKVKEIRKALRFYNVDDFDDFIYGYYGPRDPENYYLQEIKVTYEETISDEYR